jgi:iron complex outermembrane receptor protein
VLHLQQINLKQMNTLTLKRILTCLLFISAFTAWAQERGTLSGTISLSDNTAAENISVALKGTSYGTISDSEGHYEIKGIKAGNYVLRISAIGITTVEEYISVVAGQTEIRNFTLSQNQQQLDEIVIENSANKFNRTRSNIVSKMPLKDIENPQVYNTVTAELLKEQVVTNFDDALKNVPGIDKLWESTGRGGDGAGYFSLRGFAVQPTMVNGLPSITNGSPDPQNIETIDVIKGPSGTLFGSSLISYGGLINITTKKPFDIFKGNVSYTGGTYGLNRVTLDVNTPVGTSDKVFLRLNAAYHTENSFQDAGFRKSLFVAPSLSYKVNDRLSFFVNTEFYNNRGTSQTMLFLDRGAPLKVSNIDELGYDNKRSYTGNDLYIDTPTFSVQGQMNYKISDEWTSQTVVSRTSAKSDGYYSYLYEGTSTVAGIAQTAGLPFDSGVVFARYISKQNAETYGTDIQQNFIGDFKIGNFRNRIVAGLDYFNRNTVNNSSPYVNNGYVYIGNNLDQFSAIATAAGLPNAGQGDDTGILTQAGTDALLTNGAISPVKTKEEIFSAYASDIFNITPSLSAMASLRVDRFSNKGNINVSGDDYNQTALSPKFGIVYQPVLDKVSIFANYMNGFSNVAPIITADRTFTFEAEQANQFEVGTKLNLFNNMVSATISYYDIKVENTVLQVGPEQYVQGGDRYSRGFEASVTANPVQGLNVIAGYSYNDSKLTTAAEGDDFDQKRPESAGPKNLVNLWASYRFSGALDGFGLGFGGNHASENKIFNRNVGGAFTLPEYTVINASAFYNVDAFTITLKLDNITDKEYYKGWSTVNPQRPRIFAANVTYNF